MVTTLTIHRARGFLAPLALCMALVASAAQAAASTGDAAKAFVEEVSARAIDFDAEQKAAKAIEAQMFPDKMGPDGCN